MGADIHVFRDGTPVYQLENRKPAPQPEPGWLQELPSRMLNARFQVVGFTGRHDELDELRRWRDEDPRLSARWLHAPGGQGKTRLADRLAAESAAYGWKAVTALHGPGTVLPPPGSQDLRPEGADGVLLIVDYADQWPLSHLTWLFSNALLHQTLVPARVLMLARSADVWPAVRATLANHQAATSSRLLLPLPGEPGGRAEMFAAARDSFAAQYGFGDPAGIGPPGPLERPEMGLTLAVHMAALVAVDAHADGRQPPQDLEGLTIYLLDREHLHWARLYGDGTHELNPRERTYLTPPTVMNQTVFTAALTGPLNRPAAATVLDTLHLPPGPEQVVTDHATCYPPPDPIQATVLEPLYPDRLTEDFLALTLPGHTADYPTQLWAAATATTLLARHGDERAPAVYTPRAITFLAAATERWSHVGETYLYPLLRQDPQLAIDAGSAALTALSAIDDIDITVLQGIAPLLPEGRHTDLDPGIAAVVERLVRHQLAEPADPAQHARLHHSLAIRLRYAGRYDHALQAEEQAVAVWRRLVQANPAVHERDLALSLSNLGSFLSTLGRWEEALQAEGQAVAIRRRLAQADPAAHERDLAHSLTNFGGRLSEVGRWEEALHAGQQAVEIWRRLVQANPAAHEPNFALSLTNLGSFLSMLGRREEALHAGQRAAEIYRRLAQANPAAHEPGLAASLTNFGIHLWEVGRWEEALYTVQQAVAIWRRLAAKLPAVFGVYLRGARQAQAEVLDALGRTREAKEIRRLLAAESLTD